MLEGGGAVVKDVTVYETRSVAQLPAEVTEALAHGQVDWITFTSSSTAKNLAALLGANYRDQLRGVKLASIGPITTRTLVELGLNPQVEAETYDIPGLAAAMAAHK